MRKSMIWRSLLREIKGSLGRFLAIFAIVCLGVGLFSGLKITKQDFLKSMTNYYEKTAFYDYKVLGELGFSKEQAEFLAKQKDVVAAEGAFSFDAYYEVNGGSLKVGRFHSLTKKVNQVILVEGRMPEAEDECVADYYYCGKGIIGSEILLSSENTEEDLGQFTQDRYRVVGVIKSPLYVQFERGSSALGTGTIDAFFYLTEESFTSEAYTEIYVKFNKNFFLYSEEYDSYMDGKEEEWKSLAKEAGQLRFEELPDLITKAERELEEKRNEAWAELEDARIQLEDAKAEIDDGEQKIADGRKDLEKGKEDLEQAKKDLEDGKKQIEEKEPELKKGWEDLEKGKKEIEDNEKLLAEKETELEAGKQALEAAVLTVQLGEMQYELTLQSQISEQKSIDSEKEKLDERELALQSRERTAKLLGVEASYAEEFEKERDAISKERAKLDAQLQDLSKRYLANLEMKEQLEAGKAELEANQKKVTEGEEALLQGKQKLLDGKKAILDAQRKLEQGEADLKDAKNQILSGEKEIREGEQTIKEKEVELADAEVTLADGKREWQENWEKYQDGLATFKEEVGDAENAIQKLRDRLISDDVPDSYLLGRNTNIGYVCFESDSAIVDGIANVFPVFFFLVAALICVTTMNRMVEEQRTQIGVLKALGYSDGKIMFKFLFYSGSAALTGAIFGYFAGTHLFPWIIWTVYGIIYCAGSIAFAFNPLLAGISLVVSLLCSVGATYFSCSRELLSNASNLMRPRAPKTGKRVFLEYVPFIWKRLSFLRKVAVRNIMRYKKRFFMMVLGIGGCTALLVTGFGLKDSIAGVAEVQYSEIQFMDFTVTMQKEVDQEVKSDLEALKAKGLETWLAYQESASDLVTEKGQKNVTAVTLPSELTQETLETFIHLETLKGEPVRKPEKGEAVVTNQIAELLGIETGEEITLRNSDQKELKLRVIGVVRNHIFNYVYLDQASWEEGFAESYSPKSIYICMAEGHDAGELTPKLMKMDGVASVSVTRESVKRFNAMMESMNLIVLIVTACAAGLAFIVLYNLTNINVTERIREIATIKVLGFYQSETALYVFRENFVLTVLGAFVGLGMGKWLHAFVMHEVKVDAVSFSTRVFAQSYAYSVLLTILFSLIVSFMMNRRLEEISMTESLKSVD